MIHVREDSFGKLNPIVNIVFFTGMIIGTAIFFDYIFLLISFFAAFTYGAFLGKTKFIRLILIFVLPVMILSTLVNLILNQRGTSIIGYFFDRAITTEALFYGLTVALSFGTILMWFFVYNYTITSDKFMYLFGKIIPTLSLVFSMVLRFIPLFHKRANLIAEGQKSIGFDIEKEKVKNKMKHGAKILSIMTTWSLENSIDTSDSMRARGYGLSNRTFYCRYSFRCRDVSFLVSYIMLLLLLFLGIPFAGLDVYYYPSIVVSYKSSIWYLIYFGVALFSFSPMLLNLKEVVLWKCLELKI